MSRPRVRLTVAVPALVVACIAVAFLVAAFSMAAPEDVRADVYIVAERRRLILIGIAAALAGWFVAWRIARAVVAPLERIRRYALRPGEPSLPATADTALAELHAVTWSLHQLHQEYRSRLGGAATEREELEVLVDAVADGVLQVDEDGVLLRANAAAGRMLGLPADAVGQPLGTVVRNARLRDALTRAVRERALEPQELPLDERRLLVTADALPAGGVVVTLVDLTDLRRMEEVRRDFVANASHELKTPLTSIRGYTETLLRDDLSDGDARTFLETVARNAERLQLIVDDLLDLSRLESGTWQPVLTATDPAAVAGAVWRTAFAGEGEEHGVAFAAEQVEPRLEARADGNALEQVFSNLFANALRYTPEGGRITVRVTRCDDPAGAMAADGAGPSVPSRHAEAEAGAVPEHSAGWLLIEVRDTGSGIPRDALPRIFERFYRVDPARSRAEGGTGLGLSIVRHLVESMHGRVWAESELGKGTAIRFLLPAAETEQ